MYIVMFREKFTPPIPRRIAKTGEEQKNCSEHIIIIIISKWRFFLLGTPICGFGKLSKRNREKLTDEQSERQSCLEQQNHIHTNDNTYYPNIKIMTNRNSNNHQKISNIWERESVWVCAMLYPSSYFDSEYRTGGTQSVFLVLVRIFYGNELNIIIHNVHAEANTWIE